MKWVLRIIQVLLIIGFLMAGFAKIFSDPDQVREMYTVHYGYEPGFMYFIGALEALAALGLIVGFWKRLVAVGSAIVLIVIMIGATTANLKADMTGDAVVTAVYVVLFLFIGYWIIFKEKVRSF